MELVQNIALIVCLLATALAASTGIMYARHWAEMYVLRRRFEDIYLVGCLPDGTEPELGPLAELVEYVDAQNVYATQQHYLEAIPASGNELGITVHVWQYQYGKYCNESPDEYALRIAEELRTLRAARHEHEAQGDPEWYQKYPKAQRGFEYEW